MEEDLSRKESLLFQAIVIALYNDDEYYYNYYNCNYKK